MGVHGLWQLLQPAARPTTLESLQGKRLAIDSSIWLYHFHMAMRDPEGRALSRAHLLGFLWRILKLLYYGIQPVFVFDGGAPMIKRRTLAQRRVSREGERETHQRTAEKLLAAQMRAAAVAHVQGESRKSAQAAAPRIVRDVHKDPYELPAMEELPRSDKDLRYATESELRALMNSIAPEDLDINSELFRSLPPELQYELVGDLRLQSRGTSYSRLHAMLAASPTPIDFSRAQVAGLKTRNELTQKVLTVTDELGRANIKVPLRVAGMRDREYVLIRNPTGEGGFALAIRDAGATPAKAIDVDKNEAQPPPPPAVPDDEDDIALEEVEIPMYAPDAELNELVSVSGPTLRKDRALALLSARAAQHAQYVRTESGVEALEEQLYGRASTSSATDLFREDDAPRDSDEELEMEDVDIDAHKPAQEADGGATPSRPLLDDDELIEILPTASTSGVSDAAPAVPDARVQEPEVLSVPSSPVEPSNLVPDETHEDFSVVAANKPRQECAVSQISSELERYTEKRPNSVATEQDLVTQSTDAREVQSTLALLQSHDHDTPSSEIPHDGDLSASFTARPRDEQAVVTLSVAPPREENYETHSTPVEPLEKREQVGPSTASVIRGNGALETLPPAPISPDDPKRDRSPSESPFEWSPSPEPVGADGFPLPSAEDVAAEEANDAADMAEMDGDQSEFAAFVSSTSGRSLAEMQAETTAEIQSLRAEFARTRRSEEDISQQMASEVQTLLSLFGIPYITAPMEAEAQCAELTQRGLVDGIITDDSDVFLFGGTPVYRNMFNAHRVVECYFLRDVERELGLDRERLIELALLLGSDYAEGLSGVGPVLAMEILSLYSGNGGLVAFRDWWKEVQYGMDTRDGSKVRRRIKRALRNRVHLGDEWPDENVYKAYTHPQVDSSEEPFVWGSADLDGLRAFLREFLGWAPQKTDEYVLPVIEQQRKVSRLERLQTTLDQAGFVSGQMRIRSSAPYASARLQQVVRDFRRENTDDMEQQQQQVPARQAKRARRTPTGRSAHLH